MLSRNKRWCSSTEVDCFNGLTGQVLFPKFKLSANGRNHLIEPTEIGTEVEVAIMAGLPAKGNVDVDARQVNSIILRI